MNKQRSHDVAPYSLIQDPKESLGPDQRDSWRIFKIMAEFVDGFETMARVPRAVSVFGSARTKPDHPEYRAGVEIGRLLAERGLAVITGGGPGIMEAGNKGCYEAGGVSVGLNIKLPFEQTGNPYQTVGIDFNYFYARKVCFVKYSSGFICLPGGYGTMDEFFETLTLIQTMKVSPFPVVLYDSGYWGGLVEWIKRTLEPGGYIDGEDLDIFRLVDTPEQAVDAVLDGIREPWYGSPMEGVVGGAPDETGEGTREGTPIEHGVEDVTPEEAKPQQ